MVTSQILRQQFPDIQGQEIARVFKILKKHKTEDEQTQLQIAASVLDGTYTSEEVDRTVKPGTALEFLSKIEYCPSQQSVFASLSEKRRMLEQSAVDFDGVRLGPDDLVDYPLNHVTFFPNGKKKTSW